MDHFFFHSSVIVDGNKTTLKNSSLNYIKGAFLFHLLSYSSLQVGVNRVKKLGACLIKILLEHQSFLYYRRSSGDSRSNFPYNFYLEVPFISLVKAEAALRYLDSNNLYKKNLLI